MKVYPHWVYRDPSENADFLRKEREKYEASQKEAREEKAKQGLEQLFKEGGKRA